MNPILLQMMTAANKSSGGGGTPITTPTTWNPSDKASCFELSDGDLTITSTCGYGGARSLFYASTGEYYWEITITAHGQAVGVCKSSASLETYSRDTVDVHVYKDTGSVVSDGSETLDWGDTTTGGDIVGVAFSATTGELWFSKNGVWQASGNPSTGDNPAVSGLSGEFYACLYDDFSGRSPTITANFGATSFIYTVPTGFYAGFGTP